MPEKNEMLSNDKFDQWLMDQFVCPVDHVPLIREGNWFINSANPERRYPIVNEIPVFLRDDIEHTAWWAKESLGVAKRIADGQESLPVSDWNGTGVHPHVQAIIDSTGGYLYQACKGKLAEYPIPTIRVAATTNNQQPTTNNQQPTTNNQQPTTNCCLTAAATGADGLLLRHRRVSKPSASTLLWALSSRRGKSANNSICHAPFLLEIVAGCRSNQRRFQMFIPTA